MKIAHQLGVAGDIETTRGRNGGLRLRGPAVGINLGTVVRRTETDMDLVACFDLAASCAISDACVLQSVLHEALAAFLGVLDRYTLADLVAPRAKLADLLRIETPEHGMATCMDAEVARWRREQRASLLALRQALPLEARQSAVRAVAARLDGLFVRAWRATKTIGLLLADQARKSTCCPGAEALAGREGAAPSRLPVVVTRKAHRSNTGAGARAMDWSAGSGTSRSRPAAMS